MSSNTEKLMKLKKMVGENKNTISRLEGQRDQLLNTLKEQYGCSSVEEATTKLGVLETEIESLEKEISEGVQAITEQLGWEL